MSRWQLAVFVVALLGPVGAGQARVLHPCRTSFSPAPVDGVASGDWSNGYEVDFGYAAVPPKAGRNGQAASASPRPGTSIPPIPPPVTPLPSPARLYVLILVDDSNKDAGPANKAGAALLEKTIRAGVGEDRLGTIETLSGPALTLDRIRGRITALGVRPQDTVIAFYSGATEYDEPTRSYTLTPAGGTRILRAELRDLLLKRGAALTVLLTDTPANRVIPEMVPPYQPATGPFSLDRLLFGNRGIVDVQAAAANELAFPRDGEGGLFTLALVEELRQLPADGPTPAWPVLVERVRAATDRLYVDYRRAVLSSDKIGADEKRAYREQEHQLPATLTPLAKVKPAPPPAATPTATGPKAAEIVVKVPAGTKVFIEDRPTKQVGMDRLFETAELQPGRTYTYTIRAELDRDGRTRSETRRVTVRAGETTQVRFDY